MRHIKTFKLFEDKMAFRDFSGKEHVINFNLKENETLEEAKSRLLKDIKFFWLHKDESNEVRISFKDSDGDEHTSDKISIKDSTLDDVKEKFFKSLKFFWSHQVNSTPNIQEDGSDIDVVEIPNWKTY